MRDMIKCLLQVQKTHVDWLGKLMNPQASVKGITLCRKSYYRQQSMKPSSGSRCWADDWQGSHFVSWGSSTCLPTTGKKRQTCWRSWRHPSHPEQEQTVAHGESSRVVGLLGPVLLWDSTGLAGGWLKYEPVYSAGPPEVWYRLECWGDDLRWKV